MRQIAWLAMTLAAGSACVTPMEMEELEKKVADLESRVATLEGKTPAIAAGGPGWVARGSVESGGRYYGVGRVQGIANHALARVTADNRARAEVAKLVEIRAAAAFGGNSSDARAFVAKTLPGVRIVDHWVAPDGSIYALAELVAGRRPRQPSHHQRSMVSGIDAVELTADNRPLLVGERTNVLGSRKFKRLIAAGEFEAAAEIGRGQAGSGAQVLDVCMQDPDRDESADMERFLAQLTRMVKLPLMIDTTDAAVMERALIWCQGKAVLNSINLEEGRSRFDRVIPLAQRFGAAVVVGLIDETGMAVSVERKAEIAQRSYRILTEEMGFPPEDIWFDALVFPCGTGDENYIGSAARTVEGVRWLKTEAPLTRTVLGISNVSFGLPVAGREILNSVFLYHCTQAGLDAALVNTQRLARYAEIPAEEKRPSPSSPSTSATGGRWPSGDREASCRWRSGWHERWSKDRRRG